MEGYWLFLLSRNNREEPCQQSSVLKSKSWCHHQHIHYFPGLLSVNNHPKSNKKQKSLGPNWEASCDLPLSLLLPNNPKKEDRINYAAFPQSDHFVEGKEQYSLEMPQCSSGLNTSDQKWAPRRARGHWFLRPHIVAIVLGDSVTAHKCENANTHTHRHTHPLCVAKMPSLAKSLNWVLLDSWPRCDTAVALPRPHPKSWYCC